MADMFTKAKFWKCALQVNPFNYIKYRGADHGMTEAQYNQTLLDVALKNEIKVIGLADHGNVEAVDAIRHLMTAHDIIVFPGFEITINAWKREREHLMKHHAMQCIPGDFFAVFLPF